MNPENVIAPLAFNVVTSLIAPELMLIPLIVPDVGPVIDPETLSVPVTDVFSRSEMFPVVEPPRVNVWLFVVCKDPALSRTMSPERVAI